VDVYSDWIDACEAVARENPDGEVGDADAEDRRFSTYGTREGAAAAGGDEDDEDY
jgi:transcription elongation factor Elf1